jgi:Zinc finger, C2H2 type
MSVEVKWVGFVFTGSKAHSFHSMASQFITHEVQEGIVPRFTCKLCGKSFNHRDSCQKHMAIHFGTSKCYICGYVLSRKSHMKRHLRHVHGIAWDVVFPIECETGSFNFLCIPYTVTDFRVAFCKYICTARHFNIFYVSFLNTLPIKILSS